MRDRIDTCLSAAFHDVPLPPGVAERLLARLAADDIQRDRPVFADTKIGGVPPRSSRRWWSIGGGVVAAVAASLLVALWLGAERQPLISAEYAVGEAIRSFAAGSEPSGNLLTERPAPEEYPISQWVLRIRGTRWRPLDGFLGRRGVVYDLSGPAGASAALYVVARENVEGIGTEPETRPFTTAGCCASAWREGGLLYVLVVQGDRSTYGRYLNLPRSPLA